MKWDELRPVNFAAMCKVPALFIHGMDDTFITMSHTEAVHGAYQGEKDVFYCEGDHNSERPLDAQEAISKFFKKTLLA